MRRPRLDRCRTRSWCLSAIISACRTARVRKQSRRDMSNVNMVRAAYNSQVRKFNSFIQNGLFGRDRRSNKRLLRDENQRAAEFLRISIEGHLKAITDYLDSIDRKRIPSPKLRKNIVKKRSGRDRKSTRLNSSHL